MNNTITGQPVELNWETWEVHAGGCSGNARSYREAVRGQGPFTTFKNWKDATDFIADVQYRDDVLAHVNDAGDFFTVDADMEGVTPRDILDRHICKCLKDMPWKDEVTPAPVPARRRIIGNNWGTIKPRTRH